jgi:hypothetical protein
VSSDPTNRILQVYSSNPTVSTSWSTDQQIYYDYDASDTSSGVQTASGPIAVSEVNTQIFLAYQGGTISSPSNEIYITGSSSNPTNTNETWTFQGVLDPGIRTGVGLSTSSEGLNLSYENSSQSETLQISLFTTQSTGAVTLERTSSQTLPAELSNNVAISFGTAGIGDSQQLLLAGINKSENGDLVQTNLIQPWSSWNPLNGSPDSTTPALVRAGDTLYMAAQSTGSSTVQWSSSNDGGSSWSNWQSLPGSFTSDIWQSSVAGQPATKPLSMAVVNGTPYLGFLTNDNAIIITALTNASTNSWSTPYQVPGQSATYATLTSESVNGTPQLAVYYVSNDPTNRILKSYSGTPSSSSNWITDQQIYYTATSVQTASGPLAVSQYRGQSYLAYQGGTTSSPSNEIYLATSNTASINNGANWTAEALTDPGASTSLGLSGSARGLVLSYVSSALPDALTITNLTASQAGSSLLDPLQSWIDVDQTPGSLAGYSIDGNVELNGDGLSDLLISAPTGIALDNITASDPTGRSSTDPNAGTQYALYGRDLLGIASQIGTVNNDVLTGTPLADVIYSLQGNDEVSSRGSADVIYTGAGDDTISIIDNAFLRIDGGAGFNSLLLQGQTNQSFDFRLNVKDPDYFCGTKLKNIQRISSVGFGANQLYFDAAAVNALSSNRILFLTPDLSDTISLSTEFAADSSFDTSFQGVLWHAYATGTQGTAPNPNPTLIYVLNPAGAAAANWLNEHVLSIEASSAAAPETQEPAPALMSAAAPAPAASNPDLPTASEITSTSDLGGGVRLVSYRTAANSAEARFKIVRKDPSRQEVFSYASTTINANAKLGADYTAVTGLIMMAPGSSNEWISVPFDPMAFEKVSSTALSLQVQRLEDKGQKPMHLLLNTPTDDVSSQTSVFSGYSLTPNADGKGASLSFRTDANSSTSDLDSLKLKIRERSSASSTKIVASRTLSVLDAIIPSGQTLPPAYDSVSGAVALDTDERHNGQILTNLELNFKAEADQPRLSLLAPELVWNPKVQRLDIDSLQFSQNGPLTCWRADSGSGLVTFGLQAGGTALTLLSDASGGSDGSINPDNALSTNPGLGWQSTEGKAVGSRAVVEGLNLLGNDWTPTASRDGQALQLLSINIDGNQITTQFAGGVSGVYWQAIGSAPTPTPIRPAVAVQRLAAFNNSLAFYVVDSITGSVDGLNPGDAGYLQAALQRAEQDDLLLDASTLPAYGATATYTDLAIDTNRSYGVLLLQNGSRSTIFSSYSDANPGGVTQMVRLSNENNTMVLGIEDLAVAGNNSDSDDDFNDLILNITNVSMPIF